MPDHMLVEELFDELIEEISYIPMVVNFIMFLVNDIYGFINWNIMQKRQKKTSH